MSKNSSAKYYQENKERLLKSLWKISKYFFRRKKSNNMVVNVTKISQKMKNFFMKGKYEKLFTIAHMIEKCSLNKQKMGKGI